MGGVLVVSHGAEGVRGLLLRGEEARDHVRHEHRLAVVLRHPRLRPRLRRHNLLQLEEQRRRTAPPRLNAARAAVECSGPARLLRWTPSALPSVFWGAAETAAETVLGVSIET